MDCEREAGMHRGLAEYSKLAFRQMFASKERQGRDRASERAAKAVAHCSGLRAW